VVVRHLPKFAATPLQIGNEERNTSRPSFNKKISRSGPRSGETVDAEPFGRGEPAAKKLPVSKYYLYKQKPRVLRG